MAVESSISDNKKIFWKSVSFILGYCNCGCGTEIEIRSKDGKLKRLQYHHSDYKGERNNRYNGYRSTDPKGYILIRRPEHHFANSSGYVREHRLVWEEYYKACLLPWADVHHINIHDLSEGENIKDNSIEN